MSIPWHSLGGKKKVWKFEEGHKEGKWVHIGEQSMSLV